MDRRLWQTEPPSTATVKSPISAKAKGNIASLLRSIRMLKVALVREEFAEGNFLFGNYFVGQVRRQICLGLGISPGGWNGPDFGQKSIPTYPKQRRSSLELLDR